MKRTGIVIKTLAISLLSVSFTIAQSKVDPGYSVHNYKHPNKARKATYPYSTSVHPVGTVEAVSAARDTKPASSTPRYSPRRASLTAAGPPMSESIEINPLTSTAHYKTRTDKTKGATATNEKEIAVQKNAPSAAPQVD